MAKAIKIYKKIMEEKLILKTYLNKKEYDEFIKSIAEQDAIVVPYNDDKTFDIVHDQQDIYVDLTPLGALLVSNKNQVVSALYRIFYNNFEKINYIVRSEFSDIILEYVNTEFSHKELLFPITKSANKNNLTFWERKKIYTYTTGEYNQISDFIKNNKYHIYTISNNNLLSDIEKFSPDKIIVNLSIVGEASIKDSSIRLNMDSLVRLLPECNFIINKNIANDFLSKNYTLFTDCLPFNHLFDDYQCKIQNTNGFLVDRVVDEKKKNLVEKINEELFGQSNFKTELSRRLNYFIFLHKIKKKRIFSIFLLGGTGLGKTETARIINKALNRENKLLKINFGNYTSKDAVNSLIGSPLGYIGSNEGGELVRKLKNNKSGIILCDEFEKADKSVAYFFLELMEDGSFTDSKGDEHDLDGYIIIFTSNLSKQKYFSTIPPEFHSRLDLVCEFEELTKQEKETLIKHEISTLNSLTNNQYQLDISQIINLKDVRKIKSLVVEKYFSEIKKTNL
jgi:hypothetical protein